MFLWYIKIILFIIDYYLVFVMINFSVVEKDIFKKRYDSKVYYDKLVGVEYNLVKVGSFVYVKLLFCYWGKFWIYGEVIKNDYGRFYMICIFYGIMI